MGVLAGSPLYRIFFLLFTFYRIFYFYFYSCKPKPNRYIIVILRWNWIRNTCFYSKFKFRTTIFLPSLTFFDLTFRSNGKITVTIVFYATNWPQTICNTMFKDFFGLDWTPTATRRTLCIRDSVCRVTRSPAESQPSFWSRSDTWSIFLRSKITFAAKFTIFQSWKC